MRRLLLLALLLVGCASSNPGRTDSDATDWWYDVGPNGEHCLFSGGGFSQSQWRAMSCDAVNYPEPSR